MSSGRATRTSTRTPCSGSARASSRTGCATNRTGASRSRGSRSTSTSSSTPRSDVAPIDFIYQANPTRVVFGAGTVNELGHELEALGAARALILCSPSQRPVAADASDRLGASLVGVFDRAAAPVPIELAREARSVAVERGADALIAVGGGSAIGLAKAIALESAIPII